MKTIETFKTSSGKVMLPTIAVGMILFVANCSEPINPSDLPRIELTAENVVSKEVWLRVKFVNVNEPRVFVLERDGKQIAAGRMQKTDTLTIDTTALPRRSYTYKAIQLENGVRTIESDALQVMTLDTTSHAVQWVVDTLGVRGTIFDVWAFSRDQIWAAGEIYRRDSTGKEDPVLYNLARWNGQRWTMTRVMFSICNSQGVEVGFSPAIIRSVYAFSLNDVWLGGGGNFARWNGTAFSRICLPSGIIQGELLKLWGTSSNNLMCVGRNGTTIRFNGTTWQKMESGTTVDLEDVWGIDEKHVWATGTNSRDGRCVILQYNGSSWSVIYDSFGKPRELDFGFSSVWTSSTKLLFLAGESRSRILSFSDGSFRRLPTPGSFVKYLIRGTLGNDIFEVGARSEASHYNGASWYLYPGLKQLGGGFAYWYSVSVQKQYVIIGGEFFTGLFGVPVVIRGSR